MPIKKSAKKYMKSSQKKAALNRKKKNEFKKAVKKTLSFIKNGKKKEAEKSLKITQKALDKAAKSGIIKKNNAARNKSRLVKRIKNM